MLVHSGKQSWDSWMCPSAILYGYYIVPLPWQWYLVSSPLSFFVHSCVIFIEMQAFGSSWSARLITSPNFIYLWLLLAVLCQFSPESGKIIQFYSLWLVSSLYKCCWKYNSFGFFWISELLKGVVSSMLAAFMKVFRSHR